MIPKPVYYAPKQKSCESDKEQKSSVTGYLTEKEESDQNNHFRR